MTTWPVGISTGCFYRRNIRDTLGEIIHSGFHLLEISSSTSHIDIYNTAELRDIRRFIENHDAQVFSLHAPFAREIDITSFDKEERAFSHGVIKQSIRAASELGARCLVLHPWPEKEFPTHSPEKKERKRIGAEFISELAWLGKSLGVFVALENMQPQLLISPMKDLMWIHHETEEPNIAACFDIGHAFLGNIQNALRELAGHIAVVHTHDNRGKKDDHLPPGQGVVDWHWFISEVLATGFSGPFILELEDREGVDTTTVLREAKVGARFIETIVNEVSAVSKAP